MIGTGAFWQTLAKKIREERKKHLETLARGDLSQKTVGEIAGLDWVLGQAAQILGDNQHPIAQPVDDEDIYP